MGRPQRATFVPPANPPMQPAQIGPYRIERQLGSGGMGNVYYGRHQDSGEEAAIKVLPPALAREEGFVARFSREIDALQRLSNPHVVKLLGSGVDGETYYYAMEYVAGETLTSRLRREKRLHWTEVIDISIQICTALKSAHDAGVIHRDLKPSNLMITPEGMVKLADFGVAQVFAGVKLTATGGIIGTAEYMSPEQAQGKRATKQSDLYSLGAVMYAMVTGRPPFTGKTTLEVIQKHKFMQFDKPSRYVPEIPHWLEEIICKLLQKEPDQRFPDAFVLQRRLQEVLTKVSLSAESVTRAAPTDPSTPTVAAGTGGGPGAATLMRDFMRADLEAQRAGTPLSNLLNNTWILVAALVLVIAGGVWWFRPRELAPEQMLARAREILSQPPGPEWLDVPERYLLPLLERDAAQWSADVQPLLDQVRRYELENFLAQPQRLRRAEPRSEAERLLRRALSQRESGDLGKARETLQALVALTAERRDPESAGVHQLAARLLAEWDRPANHADRDVLLTEALERASRLSAEGKIDAARDIWSGIVALYDADPTAAQFVAQARQSLDRWKTARP